MPRQSAPARAEDEQTVRAARRRFARRQWARRWLAWRGLAVALLAAAVVAGAVWLVFFSAVLAVAGVQVEGTQVLDARQVRRAAVVPTGEPLATVDLDAVAARVEGLAAVRGVDVSRAWPDRVRIAITERVAVAVVERDGVVRGLDEDGVVFREYPSVPEDLPLLRVGTGTRADALAEAATVAGVLPRALAARVSFIEVHTIDRIELRLRGGRTVFWGSAEESQNKARVVEVLLASTPRARTYDVSVPGQPTTRR
jgi:cell division protein FtsQ